MKKVLFVLALAAVLVMGAHSMALGAVHSSFGNTDSWFQFPFNASGYNYHWDPTFPVLKTDTWFTIAPEAAPVLYAGGWASDGENQLGIGYFKGDFTYAEYISESDYNTLKGSYLFDNHFFAGLEYYASKSGTYDSTYLSLGYLFALGGYKSPSYIAISGDYFTNDSDSGMYAYEINAKYYGEKSKLLGQAYFRENVDEPYLAAQYNWAICDGEFTFAVRGVSGYGSEAGFMLGGTWICSENFVIDALYADVPGQKRTNEAWYVISGMFSVNDNLFIGGEYGKTIEVDDDYYIALKARYDASFGGLTFYYQLEGNDDSILMIGFQKKL